MKREYLLVVEGQLGSGYSAFMPDFPGIYLAGDTLRQIKWLTKQAVKDELDLHKEEKKSPPKPKKRNRAELEELVRRIDTPEKVQLLPIVLDVPS